MVQFRDETRKAMANQIVTAAKERFGRRLGALDRRELVKVEAAIMVQLGLDSRVGRTSR